MIRFRRDPAASRGQVLTLYAIALPAVLAIAALALDGGKLFVTHIHLQNAADAAALASSQDLNLGGSRCYQGPSATCGAVEQANALDQITTDVNCYARQNNAPVGNCSPPNAYPPIGQCANRWDIESADERAADNNCFTWPYVKATVPGGPPVTYWGRVEVRLRQAVSLAFGGLPGIPSAGHPAARAVVAFQPNIIPGSPGDPGGTITEPPSIVPGQTHTVTTVVDGTTTVITTVTPGDTHTSTNVTFGDCPDTSGACGVAFAKSTACPAITYTGNGGTTIGSLETNGGFSVTGNSPKFIAALFLGRYSGKQDACYVNKGVATIGKGPVGPFSPQDWPIPPPNVPTPVPLSQPTLTGNQCWSITGVGQATNGPGVYCSTGTLNFSGQIFKGYTFFAQCISVSGNSGDTEYYKGIPASEGARQQTLFYASGTDADCGGAAFTVQGQTNTLVGDIFAPNGKISMQGGGVQGGSGFLESQTMSFAGTFPNYSGTGPKQGGSLVVVTTTDPSTTSFSTTVVGGVTTGVATTDPSTTVPGDTVIVPPTPSTPDSTVGTTIGLGE